MEELLFHVRGNSSKITATKAKINILLVILFATKVLPPLVILFAGEMWPLTATDERELLSTQNRNSKNNVESWQEQVSVNAYYINLVI
jgi:hypothetical protein